MTASAPEPEAEGRSSAIHVASLTLTKLADGLIDPKLVLPWLLGAVGAPGAVIGALVPVREAGALLPQLWLAPRIAAMPRRRPAWAAGSAVQGLCAVAIAASAYWVGGALGGALALGTLAALACGRAACSVSHKDALARTVAKGRRGRVSGLAGSLGGAVVLAFSALLAAGVVPLTVPAISLAVAAAGGCWLMAALVFSFLPEPAGQGDSQSPIGLSDMYRALARDAELRRYLLVRGLLTSTALAPPFLVMQAGAAGDGGGARLGTLGTLMIASALAGIAASWVWGRLSDRSSRQVLMVAGALSALVLGVAAAAGTQAPTWIWTRAPSWAQAWSETSTEALTTAWTQASTWTGISPAAFGDDAWLAVTIFAAQVAYAGVRQGRKLHLVDMTDDDTRAAYTAIANTTIGAILLLSALFGLLADAAGPKAVLAVFAAASALAAVAAAGLSEVQR